MRRFRHRRLSSQIFAFLALILLVTIMFGCLLALRASQQRLDHESERRALAVAEAVAAEPEVAEAVAAHDPSGGVQTRAEAGRPAPRPAFVRVTGPRGGPPSPPPP